MQNIQIYPQYVKRASRDIPCWIPVRLSLMIATSRTCPCSANIGRTSSSEIVRGTEPTNSLTNVPPSAASGENNELISAYMLGFHILCGVFFTSSRKTCCNADELLPSSHTLHIIPNWFIKAKCCLLYIHTYIYRYTCP
jgi:hypothetical protein